MADLYTVCDVRFNRNVTLKPYGGQAGDLVNVVTAGPFLAYVDDDGFHVDFHIYSVDLSNGRFAHGIHVQASPGAIGDLVLKPNGSIAWIQSDLESRNDHPKVTLRIADTRGVRVPRNGQAPTWGTLRLHGSKLTWKKGRRHFSTRLH
jgi:hypothetical protein